MAIVITQSGVPGTAGESRDDLVIGSPVTLTDDAGGVASYFWTLTLPNGSSASLNSNSTSAPEFTPDVPGTYLISLSRAGSVAVKIGAAVLTPNRNYRKPGFEEDTEFSAQRWFSAIADVLDDLDGNITSKDATIVERVSFGQAESHNSDTPLVVGQVSLNPSDFSKSGYTTVFNLRVVASNSATGFTSVAELYNLTTDASVDTVTINQDTPTTFVSSDLTLTGGDNLYEVRIYLSAAPSGGETVELGSAELLVTHTAS